MPGTYPAAPPTLSGDLVTISRFLQNPTEIRRRLRDYRDLRFVSNRILTQQFNSTGGAVLAEQTEPFVTDRTVTAVAPGTEYPLGQMTTGTSLIAAVQKWGQAVSLTDEEIKRNKYGQSAVDRSLRKVVNSVIKQVDSVALAAVSSAVSATVAASASWSVTGTGLLYDLLHAKATILGTNLGYVPDVVLMNDAKYALLVGNTTINSTLRREAVDTPVYTGQITMLEGLEVIVSPFLPTSDVWVLDSSALGGMADEQETDPGYAGADLNLQVKAIRFDERDSWKLQGRRLTVPVVQEPSAAVRITGT